MEILDKIGVNKISKKVGGLLIIAGVSFLSLLIYNAGLFSDFSLSRLASLFFDDAEIIPLILSVILILLGGYVVTRKDRGLETESNSLTKPI